MERVYAHCSIETYQPIMEVKKRLSFLAVTESTWHLWNMTSSRGIAITKQYLIERSGKGHRTLIPIPYVQDAWRSLDTYPGVPELGRCFGEHVGLFFDKKILIVSPQTTSIDYLNPRTSLDTYAPEPSSSDQVSSRIMNLQDIRVSPAGYWIPGRILRGNEGVR